MNKTVYVRGYRIIDTIEHEKLEEIAGVICRRPDQNALGPVGNGNAWSRPDAYFKIKDKKGEWIVSKELPQPWIFEYHDFRFKLALSPFKHIGLFPEQATNWDWLKEEISHANRPIRVLNLFGYTGIASLVAAKAGAVEVVHVEASKSIVQWFKENRTLNEMDDYPIRPIQEDALTYVEREIKRGHHYDLIIMDPPAFGRGPKGEVWRFTNDIEALIQRINVLLSDEPFGILLNTYTEGFSANDLQKLLKDTFKNKSKTIEVLELFLPIDSKVQPLAAGLTGRVLFK